MLRTRLFTPLLLAPPLFVSLTACGAGIREEVEPTGSAASPPPRRVSVTPPLAETCVADGEGSLSCYSLGTYQFPTEVIAQASALEVNGVVSVSGRNRDACVIANEGRSQCWGTMGLAAALTSDTPGATPVSLPRFESVSAGQAHACALAASGLVWCWGNNTNFELGVSDAPVGAPPRQLEGSLVALAVAAGGRHTCAIESDGVVACWGANDKHQLGVADLETSVDPVVLDDRPARALDAGLDTTCIVEPEGSVACWGADLDGASYTADAQHIAGVIAAVDVAVGRRHACALEQSGRVSCWGEGSLGQLGNGVEAARRTAEVVSGLAGVVAIGAGGDVTCALLDTGAHHCWGGYAPVVIPAGGS